MPDQRSKPTESPYSDKYLDVPIGCADVSGLALCCAHRRNRDTPVDRLLFMRTSMRRTDALVIIIGAVACASGMPYFASRATGIWQSMATSTVDPSENGVVAVKY